MDGIMDAEPPKSDHVVMERPRNPMRKRSHDAVTAFIDTIDRSD